MNAGETRIELEHGAHTVLERWGDAAQRSCACTA